MKRIRLIVLVVMVILGGCVWGCSLFDTHVKEFDLMRGMAGDAALRLTDGSVGQMQVSGQGLNPGIVMEAAIVYRATARYDGLAGQFGVSAQGALGPRDDNARAWEIINDAALSKSQKFAALVDLFSRIYATEVDDEPEGEQPASWPAPE